MEATMANSVNIGSNVDNATPIATPGGGDGGKVPIQPRGTVPTRNLFKMVAKSS